MANPSELEREQGNSQLQPGLDVQPTAADAQRDLLADLRTCEAVPGLMSWQWADDWGVRFTLAASTGWPAAIRRALAAEQERRVLREEVERLRNALVPFAREAERMKEWHLDWEPVRCGPVYGVNGPGDAWAGARLSDCRRAAELLKEGTS